MKLPWGRRQTITGITTNPARGISPKRQQATRFAFAHLYRWIR